MHLFSNQTSKKRQRSRSGSADFASVSSSSTNDLPVNAYREEILQFLHHNTSNQVLLIAAATGSGKSTQIPRFLLDTTTHRMAVSQPRRVAATTLAHRVAWLHANQTQVPLHTIYGHQIGYRVRFDDFTRGSQTQLAYVTDGMLLREAMVDPLLQKYSIIFLDEAHERSLQTDILMGVVYRARQVRRDRMRKLQIVIMSATLQVETFQAFFGHNETHCLHIPGRQFPVEILYTEHPQEDYIEAALATIMQIHQHNPHDKEGDILVFLPGLEEIESLASMLKQQLATDQQDELNSNSLWTGDKVEVLNSRAAASSKNLVAGVLVCVLYAALPPDAQLQAFAPKPEHCTRKVILSTNIAETSVTLPDIRYVIDTGKYKSRHVVASTGMECLSVQDISQAQAQQRTGRAGRVQAGLCFRLFTEDAWNQLEETTVPEILRVNLGQVVLQLKGMGVKDPTEFEFVTSPQKESLVGAAKLLYALRALDDKMELTPYGRKLAKLPLDPVFGHLLLQSAEYECVAEMLTAVSMLSTDNLLVRPPGGEGTSKAAAAHRRFGSHEGDLPTFLNIYKAWRSEAIYVPPLSGGTKAQKRYRQQSQKQQEKGAGKLLRHGEWCQRNYVSGRALARAYSVRQQLCDLCRRSRELNGLGMDTSSTCGSDMVPFLKCVAAGLFLQVATRIKAEQKGDERGRSGTVVSTRGKYQTKLGNEFVSVHPTSVMFNRQPAPECVVYAELVVTKKSYIRSVTQIREEWLNEVAPNLYRPTQRRTH